jgi:predicted transposase YdaD
MHTDALLYRLFQERPATLFEVAGLAGDTVGYRLTLHDEIKAMLHLPDTDLKQTRFYREVFAEGRDEGREEGRDEAERRTAANLLRQTGLDDAAIAAATGLGVQEVAALRRAQPQG